VQDYPIYLRWVSTCAHSGILDEIVFEAKNKDRLETNLFSMAKEILV